MAYEIYDSYFRSVDFNKEVEQISNKLHVMLVCYVVLGHNSDRNILLYIQVFALNGHVPNFTARIKTAFMACAPFTVSFGMPPAT